MNLCGEKKRYEYDIRYLPSIKQYEAFENR